MWCRAYGEAYVRGMSVSRRQHRDGQSFSASAVPVVYGGLTKAI